MNSDSLRALARTLQSLEERWLHPRRRRAARKHLAEAGLPGAVLCVCHGNLCRSPYAAGAFRKLLAPSIGRQVRVDSAGFIGPGRPSPATAIAAAAARGVDLSAHRSKQLTVERVKESAVVIVMDGDQARAIARRFRMPKERVLQLGDLDPRPIEQRVIEDPMEQPREVFDRVYARIDRCLQEWVRVLFEADQS